MWTCSGIAVTSTFSLFSVLSVHILVFIFKGWGGFSIYIDIFKKYDGKINYVDHETIIRSHFRKKKKSLYSFEIPKLQSWEYCNLHITIWVESSIKKIWEIRTDCFTMCKFYFFSHVNVNEDYKTLFRFQLLVFW